MNCPKCNAPLNAGDKFCQTCGSVVPQETPVSENPTQTAQPVVENQPVAPTPMAGPQPVSNPLPSNNMGQPAPKKNNTLLFVFIGVIIVLIAVVIFLLLSPGDKKEKEDDKQANNTQEEAEKKDDEEEQEEEETPPEDEKDDDIIASNDRESIVNEYTFKLPEGYKAAYEDGMVVVYNETGTVIANVEGCIDVIFTTLDKEGTRQSLSAMFGNTTVTYEAKTVNNKNMLVYSFMYDGSPTEAIYVEYAYNKVLCVAVVYAYEDATVKNAIYDIVTSVVIDDDTFSSNTGLQIPNFAILNKIK